LAVDGGVPGVVGLLRFLRKRAGTAAIPVYPEGRFRGFGDGITREKKGRSLFL
jgi:hypothetical protein